MILRKFVHIYKKSPWQFTMIVGGLILLLHLYRYSYQGLNFWDCFFHYIDPVASIMTFITTLIIFYIQAKIRWENSIEKRLSVKYIYVGVSGTENHIVAEVIDAYLPGESDVRAWAQSLGQQMMGFLDFDMHWDENPPKVVYHPRLKNYIKAYSISVYLTSDPRIGTKLKEFSMKKFKYSEVQIPADMPIRWIEKF